jgi:AraC-like DNA-binding protein
VGASVLSVSSRALLEACARLGVDTRQILAAAGLDEATVQDPDARIPVEQVEALWRKAYELSRDPDLALHAIEVLPFGAYRVIDFLASSAPTVGAALAKVSDYFPLINDSITLPYVVGESYVTFAVESPSRPGSITRPYAEYTLAALFLRVRMITHLRFRLMRVEFSQPRPADIREHERIFDCPVRFGAETCQLVIARHEWDTPRTGTDSTLFSILDAHARMLLDRLPSASDLVGRVREAVQAELRGGDPSLEAVSRRLAMSARTLQRRLRDEGVLFNDLLDDMRFRAAKSYLSQRDIAGAEVAYLLGFAEQSSFNHAFKRWAGQTPTEYRHRNAAGRQADIRPPG